MSPGLDVVDIWLADPSISRDEAVSLLSTHAGPVQDMVDAIGGDSSRVPANFPKVAGYLTGPGVAWTNAEWARFTGTLVRINQSPNAASLDRHSDVFDIENMAETITGALAGIRVRKALNLRSCAYCDRSTLTELVAALKGAGFSTRLVAVQWAWPSTNPRTVIPGTTTTLAEANVDLSVTVADWHPERHPKRKHPTPPKLHPKVTAAGLGGAIVTGLLTLAHAKGLHLTPVEAGALTTLAATISGYLKRA